LCDTLNFQQSKHDPCVFWRGTTIIVVYTNDTIVVGPNPSEVDKAISDIAGEFQITNEPNVSDFLGVKIFRDVEQKQYTLTQPHLIQSILDDLGLKRIQNHATSLPFHPTSFNITLINLHMMNHGTINP
jgi:Reverse transcriptase (RNA-dependent DNA polymerase)